MRKGYRSLDVRLSEQFSLVKNLQGSHAVKLIYEVFLVNRGSYKYCLKHLRTLSPEKRKLLSHVRMTFKESKGSAGARTIAEIMTARGIPLSRYQAGNIMKTLDLIGYQLLAHRYKKAKQGRVTIADQLDRKFTISKSNQIWCGDVTYIWTGHRWFYLAVVMGLYAHKPVGYYTQARPHRHNSGLSPKAAAKNYIMND